MSNFSIFILSLQHVLAMFVANITPMLIVGSTLELSNLSELLQAVMLVAAINTTMQCMFGSRLPVVMGANFTFIPLAIAIGSKYGYDAVLAAALVGGIFEACLGTTMHKLKKFFPPLITGIILLSIGLSLIPVGISSLAGGFGAQDFGSWHHYLLGTPVIIAIILLNQYAKGLWKNGALFFGVVLGVILATLLGYIDYSSVFQAKAFFVPKLFPYKITLQSFHWDAILGMCVLYVVSAVETMGDMTGIVQAGFKRDLSSRELSGGITADGLGCVASSLFGVTPTTSFSQNTGIIAMTGVVDRSVVLLSAGILCLGAFSPKLATLIQVIPTSVLGASLIIMFAMISVSGIKMMTVNTLGAREAIIIAISLGIGHGISTQPNALTQAPEAIKLIYGGSGIAVSTLLSVFLNYVLPKNIEAESQSI
ncbi:nucleobase:cation symporter-2, NCS2 family [Brevinema andersonii]|uniref:Nucleobase:cation symporter-2, NCS2 family n=1 Tax=Brevinema andersonii TaxID=34097 RepID=A0A1I1EKY7_BREAD|nr:solute carrier family 23 protein [Brevinema andersonii]SFB87775.1 nucleobase:cation symporter-2, NCS2 family [Brevinema andersonii]